MHSRPATHSHKGWLHPGHREACSREGRGNALPYVFWSWKYRSMFQQLCSVVTELLLPCHISLYTRIYVRIHRVTQEERFLLGFLGSLDIWKWTLQSCHQVPSMHGYEVTCVVMMMEIKSFWYFRTLHKPVKKKNQVSMHNCFVSLSSAKEDLTIRLFLSKRSCSAH